jgi:hypothetical protein
MVAEPKRAPGACTKLRGCLVLVMSNTVSFWISGNQCCGQPNSDPKGQYCKQCNSVVFIDSDQQSPIGRTQDRLCSEGLMLTYETPVKGLCIAFLHMLMTSKPPGTQKRHSVSNPLPDQQRDVKAPLPVSSSPQDLGKDTALRITPTPEVSELRIFMVPDPIDSPRPTSWVFSPQIRHCNWVH